MEKTEVSFTVILCSYNGKKFFKEQISSILIQENLKQLLIYDDNSNDQSFLKHILQLPSQYSKLAVIRRTENLGVVDNFVKAIKENQNASFIALADQDDIWSEKKLAHISSEFISSLEPVLVYHDAQIINEEGQMIDNSFFVYQGKHNYIHCLETFLFGNYVSGACCAFSNALTPFILRIPKNTLYLHDEWIALCALIFGRIKRVNTPLNQYRKHGDNLAFKKSRAAGILNRLSGLIEQIKPHKNSYLNRQFELVEDFTEEFGMEIPVDKRRVLEEFLALRYKAGWRKRAKRKKVLQQYKLPK